MGDLQITVGDAQLHKSWPDTDPEFPDCRREIWGKPQNEKALSGAGGVHSIAATVRLYAPTDTLLAQLWQATVAEFDTRNARVKLFWDVAGTEPREDLQAGEGQKYTEIATAISEASGANATRTMMVATFTAAAAFEIPAGLAGQLGDVVMTKSNDINRRESRVLTARFNSEANYAAARATLMGATWLDTGSNGSRGTGGQCAVEEQVTVAQPSGTVDVALSSVEGVDAALFSQAARSHEFDLAVTPIYDFPADDPQAGPAPVLVTASGTLVLDKSQLSQPLATVFEALLPVIDAKVRAVPDTGGDIARIARRVRLNTQGTAIVYAVDYVGRNSQIRAYKRIDSEAATPLEFATRDFNGVHSEQAAPGPPQVMRTITVTRVGVGLADIRPPFGGIDLDITGTRTYFYRDRGARNTRVNATRDDQGNEIVEQYGEFMFEGLNLGPLAGGTPAVAAPGVQ